MSAKSVFVNALTFLRVPLIVAWLVCALSQEFRGGFWLAFAACASMLLSGLTDALDGALARRWNVVSQLGKMADPLMDKVFYAVAFPALAWQAARHGQEVHSVVLLVFTILYIVRDLWVTFMRSIGAMFGANVAAMKLGKVRTALSFPTAGLVYGYLVLHREIPVQWDAWWLTACYAVECAMVALNLLSTVTYTRAYAPYLKKALERK